MTFDDLPTPCLVLDERTMARNITRLTQHLHQLGVPLRPHLKTAKSIDIARRLMPTPAGPATVSTLKEAEHFAAAGVRDLLYAVGIAPAKLPRVVALRAQGVDLSLVLDSEEQARAVVAVCQETHTRIPVLIEIDADGHRSGVRPDEARLLEIGRLLQDGGAVLRGVMTHAGGAYEGRGVAALELAAEHERNAACRSAAALRAAGLPCPVVSVGSTPTAQFARTLDGVTEVRAGVFPFGDLVMVELGVCALEDIALSVLATVIGHQREQGWLVVDAGWMALSADRGVTAPTVEQGYGLVCDTDGRPYPDLIVASVNQEHGIVAVRRGSSAPLPSLPIGSLVRILPQHACATAAQHDRYHVLGDDPRQISVIWQRFSGW